MCNESSAVNVAALRDEIFADGKVTKEEVLVIWEKKDAQEGNTSSEFDSLFAEVVMAWLLADGKIDEEEAQFLIDKITEDNEIDNAEEELLETINEHRMAGNEIPTSLLEAFEDFFKDDEEEEEEEE